MIKTDVMLNVMPDEDYYYEVCVGEVFSITYKENTGQEIYLTFGSSEEMRAVARAMLQACSLDGI